MRRVQVHLLTYLLTCRLPQRRSTAGTGSRLPTAPLTSKHVTSGTTRDTTVTTTTNNNNNNNNNNSPAGDSPTHRSTHGPDVSHDIGDGILDQSVQARPSPAGKRPRKGISVGGRVARQLPGHGETVDSDGQPRRAPAITGKLSVSATSSPVNLIAVSGSTTSGNTSSRKQPTSSSSSASLTDVPAKSESGRTSPELARRKAATSSRLAVSRASGRPHKTARPASDGGGTATGSASYRSLGSKLPSLVTGSVGAISDSGVMTSFKPGQQQHQQLSSKAGHRPAASTPSTSPLRLTELPVQSVLGHDTQRVVAADLPSPLASGASSATPGTADETRSLSRGQEDFHRFPDKPVNGQNLPEDQTECQDVSTWQKNCQGLVDSKEYKLCVTDWRSDEQNFLKDRTDDKTVFDEKNHHQNVEGDHQSQQYFRDEREVRHKLIDGNGISETLPIGQENHQYFMDEPERRNTPSFTDDQKQKQSFFDTDKDPLIVPSGQRSPGRQRFQLSSDNDRQLVVSEDGEASDAAAAYRVVGRTTSFDNNITDVKSFKASCGADVILPSSTTSASSVVMTTDATESTKSAAVSGKEIM